MQNTFGPHLQNLMITSQNSSPAVPHSITGCFATQNIGEVARSDGGISSKKILYASFYPLSSSPPLLCLSSIPLRNTRVNGKAFSSYRQNYTIKECRKTPPLCFATQNIGEVARSGGGVSSKKILVKIIYLMGKIGSFLLPAFSFAEKKQQQSTSHLMCAASQNARRVLRFRGTAPLRNARLGTSLLHRSDLPVS